MSDAAMLWTWIVVGIVIAVGFTVAAAVTEDDELYGIGLGIGGAWPLLLGVALFCGAIMSPYLLARGVVLGVKWWSTRPKKPKLRATKVVEHVDTGPYRTPPPSCPTCGRLSEGGGT